MTGAAEKGNGQTKSGSGRAGHFQAMVRISDLAKSIHSLILDSLALKNTKNASTL